MFKFGFIEVKATCCYTVLELQQHIILFLSCNGFCACTPSTVTASSQGEFLVYGHKQTGMAGFDLFRM